MCDIIEIYVVCPASCKLGIPYGKWIDATKPLDEIQDDIKTMLANSPTPGAKEFKIRNTHDPTGYDIVSKINDLEKIHEIALFVEEHGDLGAALLDEAERDLKHATSLMEEAYCGEFESKDDYVLDFIENRCTFDDWLRPHIDLKSIWHDLEIEGYIAIELGFDEVHVFSVI